MIIEVTSEALATMRTAAGAHAPGECCGLLLGDGSRVERAVPTGNVASDPLRRFEIDPRALIDAHRTARAGGAQLLGYFHSHPAGSTAPSHCDAKEAAGDGRIWAIVAAGKIAFWRDDVDGFAPLEFVQVRSLQPR